MYYKIYHSEVLILLLNVRDISRNGSNAHFGAQWIVKHVFI
jgi:hypothetical protein